MDRTGIEPVTGQVVTLAVAPSTAHGTSRCRRRGSNSHGPKARVVIVPCVFRFRHVGTDANGGALCPHKGAERRQALSNFSHYPHFLRPRMPAAARGSPQDGQPDARPPRSKARGPRKAQESPHRAILRAMSEEV